VGEDTGDYVCIDCGEARWGRKSFRDPEAIKEWEDQFGLGHGTCIRMKTADLSPPAYGTACTPSASGTCAADGQ
jgi:hypothetical protein